LYKNSWTLSISGHHPHVSLEAALDRSPTDVVWNGHRVVAEGGELCARGPASAGVRQRHLVGVLKHADSET